MKKFLLSVMLGMASLPVFAECYTAENFQLGEMKKYNKYEVVITEFIENKIQINFDAENSSVSNGDLKCFQHSNALNMVCFGGLWEGAAVETWSADLDNNVILYTKNMNGYGKSGIDGATIGIGFITGRCDM